MSDQQIAPTQSVPASPQSAATTERQRCPHCQYLMDALTEGQEAPARCPRCNVNFEEQKQEQAEAEERRLKAEEEVKLKAEEAAKTEAAARDQSHGVPLDDVAGHDGSFSGSLQPDVPPAPKAEEEHSENPILDASAPPENDPSESHPSETL